ncbi:unnamed protein product [Nippostrongylus brasiliensis]|uniref:CX domain-containing protein n=1 Tax=Nippostrongylus brasiliensis TaxID=27835 RepID=A0A0N4YUC1_NIPBR|nr:unnamed protein product [Nippostrongylus brasiliensis]
MDLARRMVQCGSITTRTLDRIYNSSVTLVQIASRRWRPQPILRRRLCTKTAGTNSDAKGFELVFLESGEQVANDALFEASMKKSSVPWKDYSRLMKDEKSIYMAHLNAVENRKLLYKDPTTGYIVFSVSQHLHKGSCCGNGCRHCPYGLENCADFVKKKFKWNGAYYVQS